MDACAARNVRVQADDGRDARADGSLDAGTYPGQDAKEDGAGRTRPEEIATATRSSCSERKPMAKILPASRSTADYTRVENASHILKRFYVAERHLMRTLAAWFVQTSQWDLK